VICGLAVITRVALPYLSILMPKVVLDQIASSANPESFLIIVGSMALLMVVANYIKTFSDATIESTIGIVGIYEMISRRMKKMMTMDYEVMEDPEYSAVQDKAKKAMFSNHAPAVNIPGRLVELLSNSFGFLLYACTIALIHPLILLVLLITAGVNWSMLSRVRRYMEDSREKRSVMTKRLTTLYDTLRKPEAAKDIRLYGAFGWLHGLYKTQYSEYQREERKLLTKNMHAGLVDALMILLRDGAAYAFLIWLVMDGQTSLGDFVFVFAAIGALAGWVSGILTSAGDLHKACIEMGDVRAYNDYPDKMNTGQGIPLPTGDELPPSIEFRDVGYTYPNSEKVTLSGINATVHAGERIAIVGVNGAGKTTLIKLLCGLYTPSEGEVLLNGKPVDAKNCRMGWIRSCIKSMTRTVCRCRAVSRRK